MGFDYLKTPKSGDFGERGYKSVYRFSIKGQNHRLYGTRDIKKVNRLCTIF